ncbi:BadF/BadG/BcrA/BcrD ATPase family protein [Massilia sp. CFBP9026]|uniref:BadF/BadG/BcrA/BcrD ATPase family protein n=1 Tax=Massilia sp. CFBP9026 TaxID=3096536 RepID=UPI002A6B2F30|nr:BadF/BadG/BcrA/BcrD ATPase family protein [Massilia sp. CFBP9026]MDY0964955.1 BadF/BadG/BcrA/BcrD ATPase family protein [Massilia sp. CFBP9026]
MIDYLIGVDGGGTNTRVRLAGRDGAELATGRSGASGLVHGIDKAWRAVEDAAAKAFAAIGIDAIPRQSCAIGLGLAGVHNKEWAAAFRAANPGYAALVLDTDGFSTLMGAHGGRPGAIVAIGTGSVGEALREDGTRVEVGGWGFPSGDEAGGAWMGLRAIAHVQQVLDGRAEGGALARDVIKACGGGRDAIQVWLGKASQTDYASLARFVVEHGALDPVAGAILEQAGREVATMARALDPGETLPLSLCGGLGDTLRLYLPAETLARCSPPHGDSALGALRMIELHLKDTPA